MRFVRVRLLVPAALNHASVRRPGFDRQPEALCRLRDVVARLGRDLDAADRPLEPRRGPGFRRLL